MKQAYTVALLPLLLVAGCATTANYTPKERASCEAMEKDMGLGTMHDHQAMKGQGMNPMNLSHERCMQILGH